MTNLYKALKTVAHSRCSSRVGCYYLLSEWEESEGLLPEEGQLGLALHSRSLSFLFRGLIADHGNGKNK